MGIGSVLKTGVGFTLKRFLSISFITIILFVLLLNSIVIGVQEKSLESGLKDLGSRFLFSTKNLNDASLSVLEEGGSFIRFISLFSGFFIAYAWVKILSKIWGSFTPFSNESQRFVNVSMGILGFFVIQIIILVGDGGWKEVPILWHSFINFFLALGVIIPGLASFLGKFGGKSLKSAENITNIAESNLTNFFLSLFNSL